MDYQKETDALYTMVSQIVKKEMQNKSNYLTLFLPGEVYSVNGSFADVIINNTVIAANELAIANDLTIDDYTTFNVPINPAITVVAGDHVWVLKINFQDTDKIILCKRVVS